MTEGGGRAAATNQAVGGQQGDPLMPLLFCLAVHDAFAQDQEHLQEGEVIFAFLEMCTRCPLLNDPGTSTICSLRSLHDVCMLAKHERGTEQAKPERMEDLEPSVWSPEGLKILGTPMGTPEFHSQATRERLEVETQLWRAIPWVPDLQCSWPGLADTIFSAMFHSSILRRTRRPWHEESHDDVVGRVTCLLVASPDNSFGSSNVPMPCKRLFLISAPDQERRRRGLRPSDSVELSSLTSTKMRSNSDASSRSAESMGSISQQQVQNRKASPTWAKPTSASSTFR